MNRDEYRQLLLAGTVTFPATFPQLGTVSLVCEQVPSDTNGPQKHEMLLVKEHPSAKVTISRKIFVDQVRAVFVPKEPSRVSYDSGKWLLADEIAPFFRCREHALAIVFVPESEPSLLEVRAGMTAAESAQYYPPLPVDRSFNHYGGQPQPRHSLAPEAAENPVMKSVAVRSPALHSQSLGEMEAAFMFSCDVHDDVTLELCSCDPDDTPSES